jgi:tetratricopeptide (TPR) repeat protein
MQPGMLRFMCVSSVSLILGACSTFPKMQSVQEVRGPQDSWELNWSNNQSSSFASKQRSASNNILKLARDIDARGEPGTALPLYERATKEQNAGADAFVALGEVYNKLGRHNDAAIAFRRALDRDPQNVAAFFGLGSTFLRMGQVRKGREILERVAQKVNSPRVYDRLGVAYMMSGKPAKAYEFFERAYAKRKRDPDIGTNMALAAALMGHNDRAAKIARDLLIYAKIQDYHRRNLVLALAIAGKSDEAKEIVGNAIAASALRDLIRRAKKIRTLSTPKERAVAMGMVKLSAAETAQQ